jgi:uncharacterized Ntn-hydrolase superfamily protein
MAATQHGTAYVYGVDSQYFATALIVSISRRKSDKNNDGVENGSGQLVSLRCDDETDELNATLRIESGFAAHTVAAKVTIGAGRFNGDYRVTTISESASAKGYTDYQVTMVKDEYLPLT